MIGFTVALELAQKERIEESKRLIQLRDYFIKRVLKEISDTFLNGHPQKRLPNNINISFLNVEGESVLLYLNGKGICVSTGSACSSQKLEISHVLKAIGLRHEAAHGSIRFTMGRKTTKAELDYVIKVLPEIILPLRRLSPVHLKMTEIRI